MFEKKIQSALFVGLVLLAVSACNSQSGAAATVADARAAALTNQVDDDKDGHVDENDEGLDEDEDGHVDESGEHHDACEHRHHAASASAPSVDSSDSDAGVDEDHSDDEDRDSEERGGHHEQGDDSDKDSDETMSRDAKRAADIAAIDCSDVPSASDDATPVDAGL